MTYYLAPAPLLALRTVTYCTENEWTPIATPLQLPSQSQADLSIDAAFATFVAAEAGSEYPRQVESKGRRHDERSGSQTAVEVAHQVSQIEHG
jgi:hypothetical protein